jgi:hypothetical protein
LPPITSSFAPPFRRRRSRSADPMPADEAHHSAAHSPDHVAAPIGADEAAQALRDGPIGALTVASIAVGLLFVGWLLFYFFLFMPRGAIG